MVAGVFDLLGLNILQRLETVVLLLEIVAMAAPAAGRSISAISVCSRVATISRSCDSLTYSNSFRSQRLWNGRCNRRAFVSLAKATKFEVAAQLGSAVHEGQVAKYAYRTQTLLTFFRNHLTQTMSQKFYVIIVSSHIFVFQQAHYSLGEAQFQ